MQIYLHICSADNRYLQIWQNASIGRPLTMTTFKLCEPSLLNASQTTLKRTNLEIIDDPLGMAIVLQQGVKCPDLLGVRCPNAQFHKM